MATADTINSIRTHLENDYEGLENLGVTAEDRNIENIRTCLDELYNNIPKTTDTGTNLSLNTIKGKMNIIPKGNIEQETREGYNLFQAKLQTTTANGITVTNNNNGTFTINGTNTSSSLTTFRLDQSTQNGADNLQNYEDGTYTLDLGIQNENIQITLMQVNTWQQFIATGMNTRLKSGTITGATGMFIYIAIKGNATFNNVVIKPMFVKGSYTTSTIPSFEQYGQMPSPSYPSDIEVVTGTQDVKVENVNLFNENWTNGIRLNATTGVEESNANSCVSDYIPVNFTTNPNYYLSGLLNTMHSTIWAYNSSKQGLHRTANETRTNLGLTSSVFVGGTAQGTGDIAYIRINMRIETGDTGSLSDLDNASVQLEKGSVATTYTPHQEQTQTISLGNIELCKIGNYQDYLYKSGDKWYKKENIGKVVFNGSETGWAVNGSVFYRQITNIMRSKIQMYSNFYNYKNVAWTGLDNNEMTNDNASNTIFIKDTRYTVLNDFKNFLSNNNMELYYVLATPNDIQITNETSIEQLNNLEKMYSYNGITNISSNGNLPIVLGVSALKGE